MYPTSKELTLNVNLQLVCQLPNINNTPTKDVHR